MRITEMNPEYIIYEYNETEFFEWEKDTETYKKHNALLDSYKVYGRAIYHVIVDYRQWNYNVDKALESNALFFLDEIEPCTPGLLYSLDKLTKDKKSV
jgi:hypothetical protein